MVEFFVDTEVARNVTGKLMSKYTTGHQGVAVFGGGLSCLYTNARRIGTARTALLTYWSR